MTKMDLTGFSRKRVMHYTHDCPRCKQTNICCDDPVQDDDNLDSVKQDFVCDACGLEWYLKFEFSEGKITTDLESEQ